MANDDRLTSLEGDICTDVIASQVLLQMTSFRLSHKQHTGKEPAEFLYSHPNLNLTVLYKISESLESCCFHIKTFEEITSRWHIKEEAGKRPESKSESSKNKEESQSWKCTRTNQCIFRYNNVHYQNV